MTGWLRASVGQWRHDALTLEQGTPNIWTRTLNVHNTFTFSGNVDVLACGLAGVSISIAIHTTDRFANGWAFTGNTFTLCTSLTASTVNILNTPVAIDFISAVIAISRTVTFLNGV